MTTLNESDTYKAYCAMRSYAFGAHLAGLIDADGRFNKRGHLEIAYHARERPAARALARVLGGRVYATPNAKALTLRVTRRKNLARVASWVRHKLKNPDRLIQYNTRLIRVLGQTRPTRSTALSAYNAWFAGFTCGDGCFQIKVRRPHPIYGGEQVELMIGFELSHGSMTAAFVRTFGGITGRREGRNTYYYSSVNQRNAARLVTYFDRYPVYGSNGRAYAWWRRAVTLVLTKQHLTPAGLAEVKCLKGRLSRLRGTQPRTSNTPLRRATRL